MSSHHCHDEHDHDHSHDGAAHDHSDDITPALQHSLYSQIEFDRIETFNESVPNSGKAILKKTWAERMSEEGELCSDTDEQILIHIPYVHIRYLLVFELYNNLSLCTDLPLKSNSTLS